MGDWLNIYPQFYDQVLSYFKTDRYFPENKFRSVCKKWNEIYKKNEYLKFKHYILNPTKKHLLDVDFLILWDCCVRMVEAGVPVETSVGLTDGSYLSFDFRTSGEVVFIGTRNVAKTLGFRSCDYLKTYKGMSPRYSRWRITNLDKFLVFHYLLIKKMNFSQSIAQAMGLFVLKPQEMTPVLTLMAKGHSLSIRQACFFLRTEERFTKLFNLLKVYNTKLSLWN